MGGGETDLMDRLGAGATETAGISVGIERRCGRGVLFLSQTSGGSQADGRMGIDDIWRLRIQRVDALDGLGRLSN